MLLGAKARGGIVLSLIGTAMAGMFFTSACTSGKVNAEGPAPVAVSMATVSVQTVPVIHEFVGQTSAKETVDLRARVSGFLEKVNFQEGAHVSAGQTLFEIEPASYQAALASAQALLARDRANLTKAVKDVARLRPLVASHAAPEQDLDTAVAQQEVYEAAIKGDEASIADARLNLGYTVIRSPIDGVIGKLAVTRGNLVGKNENTLLATVSSSSPIYEQRGTINFADRAVDTSTGTLSLRGSFPNPKGLLRPGQFARVKVEGEQLQNAILIPQKAVSELLNQRVVMTVDAKNVVGLQPVTIAGTHDDQFIISSGLKGGERIVVDGLQKVHAGATVVPAAASGAQSAGGR
jgi:membrane fusion protein (multidrug efflux system)